MPRIDRVGSLCRRIAGAALTLALLSMAVPAHADPTTNERRRVAEDVAATICQTIPAIPKLPSTVNPHDLCVSVIVENVDPEGNNTGIRAACELALSPGALAAAKYCVQVIDKLLDPARALFLDKIVPAAEQLACVTANPAAFECLTQQMHVWMKQSIVSLWQGLITTLTSDTKAISLIDGWTDTGIVSLYGTVGSLGALLLLGLLITSLVVSTIRLDFRGLGSTVLNVVTWGLFWSGGAVIAVMLLKASDEAARWLGGQPDANGDTDLSRAGKTFANWVDYITSVSSTVPVHPLYQPGSTTAILICLLLIVAIVITLVALLMRNVALLLIIVLLPLTLAGSAGPRMTREWFTAAMRMFLALLLAKPLIVLAMRLGAVLVNVPQQGERPAGFADALLGVTIILLAGLLPGVIYRFSGGLMNTSAGGAPRATGGVTGQATQSTQSTIDMTRLIMERNRQPALSAGSSGVAGARAGAAGGGGALGAAAGPIGLAALGVGLVGGAIESGSRWAAGQAATAGGVFGDVEAPHIPSAPISRMGYHSRPGDQHAGTQSAAQPQTAAGERPHITVVQMQPEPLTHPPLPDGGPHLVIPGTVVPDAGDRLAVTKGPRALPAGGEEHG